jgi:hypothetical protein
LDDAFEILRDTVTNYNNHDLVTLFGGKIDLKEYVFQVVPAMTQLGDKVIWVNALCLDGTEDIGNLRNEIVEVNDGGKCYFNIGFNLRRKTVTHFYVNGYQ